MRVLELNIHPVKSGRPFPVDTARVERWGLAGDRRWMLVDGDGRSVTAREEHRLLTVVATPVPDGVLIDGGPLLREPAGESVAVRHSRHELRGVPAGPEADAWFRRLLGRADVRLVWCAEPAQRALNPAYSEPDDRTGFVDGYPVVLSTTGSLDRLNAWIVADGGEPLPMVRFRPNVVVDSAEPFAEDDWKRIRIGAVEFRVAKLVDRCVMTTVDPETLAGGKEPIRTLARHRRWDGTTWFGIQLIPDAVGTVHVGDQVEILA
ncbi:MOSC domain-containing protein [Longispora sp. K20-0274]|uniref:MOSC domain-containing protein n=1 Tax=Longispora sp. K20-0274 TaxID=3088255 RepID=UPI00399B0CBA